MMENKKKIISLVLAAALVVAAVGTTIAWLTSSDEIANTFTVGTFTEPTTDPEDSSAAIDTINGTLSGNLYEKSWKSSDNHKLLPGIEFNKDPYVGIGPGSEDGVVYLYVENNFSNADNNYSNKIYFTINDGWEAVSGYTTAGATNGSYTSGLFKYTAGLTGSASADSWTDEPLFSKIIVAADADADDFKTTTGNDQTITVKSFIHQANDSSGSAISDSTILKAAKDTFGLA